jgi:hypothetical protein
MEKFLVFSRTYYCNNIPLEIIVTTQTTLQQLKTELKEIYANTEEPAMGYRKISWLAFISYRIK